MTSGTFTVNLLRILGAFSVALSSGQFPAELVAAHEGVLLAQSEAPDWTATRLLDVLAKVQHRQARFVETHHHSVLKEPLTTKGVLRFTAPSRFEKEVQAPFMERYVIDGDTLQVYRPEESDRMTISVEEYPELKAFLQGFLAVLRGDLSTLRNYYSLQLDGDQDQWSLQLRPLQEEFLDQLLYIGFTGRNSEIVSVEVKYPDGSHSQLSIIGPEQ